MHEDLAAKSATGEVSPLNDRIASLFDHAERLDYALANLTERLADVMQPEQAALDKSATIESVPMRPMSSAIVRLTDLDVRLVRTTDRINELKDRLDT